MSVNIQIDENWKITSDKHGYQLSRFSYHDEKKGEDVWIAWKFAGNIRIMLESWAEQKVRESDATTFKELHQEIKRVRERLDEIASACEITGRETASAEEAEG